MKVLMVTPYYYPWTIGGTETQIENKALKLNQRGIQTDILTFNYVSKRATIFQSGFEVINGLNVFQVPAIMLPRPSFFVNHIAGNFRKKLKQYDIIHFHNETDLSFPLFSYGVKVPKILHCHCLDTTYFDYKRNFVAAQIFKKSADVFITLSKALNEMLLDLGIPKEKLRILQNEVDTEKFKVSAEKKTDNLLLFVGRLDPKKGIPFLLQSLKYLKKPVKLVMVGPPSNYKEYSEIIINLIEQAKKNTVHSITYVGQVGPNELVQWYQKAAITVLPSVAESFPMTTMESLACGTPMVASDVGAVSEVVHDHENGLLVPPKDPIKLAEAIQYLLDNESERLKLGKQGAKYVNENFSSEVMINQLIKMYNSLL
jgi:glycosyltransferase involved in cell wall biosynthesis